MAYMNDTIKIKVIMVPRGAKWKCKALSLIAKMLGMDSKSSFEATIVK